MFRPHHVCRSRAPTQAQHRRAVPRRLDEDPPAPDASDVQAQDLPTGRPTRGGLREAASGRCSRGYVAAYRGEPALSASVVLATLGLAQPLDIH